jgi:hypothetical protein
MIVKNAMVLVFANIIVEKENVKNAEDQVFVNINVENINVKNVKIKQHKYYKYFHQ